MAKYRQIHTAFWNDGFVLDLTPEEKYFYLYLLTNPKVSQCGIYELPKRIIEAETGYNRETIQKLLQRFVDYKKIDYFEGTKECMIRNWIKYNPPNNVNAIKCIMKELNDVKNIDFVRCYVDSAIKNGYELEGLPRGLEGATEGLPSNKVISNKEEIKSNNVEDNNDVLILTSEEAEFLKVLESIPNYPFDRHKDLEMYKTLEKRYPKLNLVESIKDWAFYKQDKPLKAKDNPRSQINMSFKKYEEWDKNLKTDSDPKPSSSNDFDFTGL